MRLAFAKTLSPWIEVGCSGKAKWFKRAGVYYMIFKVPALREEIGDPLDIYSVDRDNSPT